MRQQPLVGLLVAVDRFLETVLAVVDVPDVQLQAGEAQLIALAGEDLAGLDRRLLGPLVLAEQDERLDRGAEGPAHLRGLPDLAEQPGRLLVVLDGRLVLVERIQGVALCAQALGERLGAPEPAGDELGGLREGQGLFDVDPDPLGHDLAQPRHRFTTEQLGMLREELAPAAVVRELRQLRVQPFVAGARRRGHLHRKPIFSRCRRRRVKHRPRMNAIDPVASPRLRATSR